MAGTPGGTCAPQEGRRAFERRLFERMVHFHCERKHGSARGGVCGECASLIAYATERLKRCPYGDEKPTCRKCPVHCYRPAERARAKDVMRFAGPRLLLRGDWQALMHALHGLLGRPRGR